MNLSVFFFFSEIDGLEEEPSSPAGEDSFAGDSNLRYIQTSGQRPKSFFFFSLLCDVVSDATDTIRFRVFFLNNQNPGTTVKSLGTGDRYQYYMNA